MSISFKSLFREKFGESHFLILGSEGLTGLSAANFLEQMEVAFSVSDIKPENELLGKSDRYKNIRNVYHSGHELSQLEGITDIIVSPGVPPRIDILQAAREQGISIWSDIALASEFIDGSKLVAVTGTDGKTTTSTLIHHILSGFMNCVLAGNMGIPILEVLEDILRADKVVLELSAFQLEIPGKLKPAISYITNIAQDHVERYENIEEYRETKFAIIKNCTWTDIFIRNTDDLFISDFDPGNLTIRDISAPGERFNSIANLFICGDFALPLRNCKLRGMHNVRNICAALEIACVFQLDGEKVLELISTFKNMPHRFENVGVFDGVTVIDDSKATTVSAVAAALEALETSAVLIMGGMPSGRDYTPLNDYIHKIKWLITYGDEGQRILSYFKDVPGIYEKNFPDAVKQAVHKVRKGETLLLSPANWDKLRTYVERGRIFVETAKDCLKLRLIK
ncbi:UDP-N-acetylmuramoyl-L-alanine--D-glutamate ligase [Myxococcota bacterium]|nr:UDP-N-acetylmuramoyl-L-alanine--D-glutamate ligase [Myxococcota bacterium]MBU1382860.1 UDP-N-acetylmuramoyl-L-alanine--D-glutamate ligase [Myxococcota bacterium]MBU1496768.1 UDP-N-acetylmuramoyl-L-alanine--D-glutamate ligase [Myxococcota bacterium]